MKQTRRKRLKKWRGWQATKYEEKGELDRLPFLNISYTGALCIGGGGLINASSTSPSTATTKKAALTDRNRAWILSTVPFTVQRVPS
jgi:hypothetical protein